MSAHDEARLFVLKIEGSTPGTFSAVAGLTNVTFNGSTSVDDVTTKGDNQFAANAAGRTSATISAEGFCRDEALADVVKLQTLFLTRAVKKFQVVGKSGDGYVGEFMLTAFTTGGGTSGAQTFSITLQSMGEFAAIV